MKKLIILIAFSFIAAMCEKKEATIEPVNLKEYAIHATFDDGRTVHFSQFMPETTNEGILSVGCFFEGDQKAVGFGASNYLDPTKSNGFTAGFKVSQAISARANQFAKENANGDKTTTYLVRTATGSASLIPSPLKLYDNSANYGRFRKSDGFCDEEEQTVDFQKRGHYQI